MQCNGAGRNLETKKAKLGACEVNAGSPRTASSCLRRCMNAKELSRCLLFVGRMWFLEGASNTAVLLTGQLGLGVAVEEDEEGSYDLPGG